MSFRQYAYPTPGAKAPKRQSLISAPSEYLQPDASCPVRSPTWSKKPASAKATRWIDVGPNERRAVETELEIVDELQVRVVAPDVDAPQGSAQADARDLRRSSEALPGAERNVVSEEVVEGSEITDIGAEDVHAALGRLECRHESHRIQVRAREVVPRRRQGLRAPLQGALCPLARARARDLSPLHRVDPKASEEAVGEPAESIPPRRAEKELLVTRVPVSRIEAPLIEKKALYRVLRTIFPTMPC